jgi:predicted transcriptional regulator
MYTLPQEIEVWYIIPAIRRELSKCMIRDYKVTYENVGLMLGISKAAVSQYLKGKRASKIKLHVRAMDEVCKSCGKLVKNKSDAVNEIGKILKFIREKNLHCEVCGEVVDGVHKDCVEIKANYENEGDYAKNRKAVNPTKIA